MTVQRRLAYAAALLFAALAARAALADPVTVRAAAHDGYGRIVFAWPAPVAYDAQLAGAELTVHFARALDAKFAGLGRELNDYIASAAVQPDGKTFVAHLRRPVVLKAFAIHGATIVIDLRPVAAAPAKEAAAKPAPAKPAPAKPIAVAQVPVRGFTRKGVREIGFAWPRHVEYGFAVKDGAARLSFAAAGEIDAAALAKLAPELAPKLAAHEGGVAVEMTVPDGMRVKPARRGNLVLLEIAGKPKPPPQPAPPPVPVAAAAPASAPPPVAQAAPSAPPPASVAVRFASDGGTVSLRFDWPIAVPAAVFRRAGALWIVFGAPTRLDLAEPQAKGGAALGAVQQLPVKDATVLRLVTEAGLTPGVRRAGAAWIVDLKTQPVHVDAPIAVAARAAASPASVVFAAHEAGAPVTLHDPALGDELLVVPLGEAGRGLDAPQQFVDFRALASVQGLVLRPFAGDLALHVDSDAVTATRPGGLRLSSAGDRLLGQAPAEAHALFEFAAWAGPPHVDFAARRSQLERAITAAPEGARSAPRLALAQFYFAHRFAAETIAVLDAIAKDDAAFADQPRVHALKGGACLLAGEIECANAELGNRGLDREIEAVLWRASAAAAASDWESAARGFLASAGMLPRYPRDLRSRFGLEAAEAMLETNRADTAMPLIELVQKDKPAPEDAAMAHYLEGRVALAAGRLDDALGLWDKAAAAGVTPVKARALFARATALYDSGRVPRADTIKTLDGLRFMWRGDGVEFALLRRLGELEIADGEEDAGLELMQQAVRYFPNYPQVKDIAKEMGDSFAALFLGPDSDTMPPLKSLAIYDRFNDIEPPGERHDRIVRKLVDRLVAVDLLDRASDLLDGLVTKRLAGLDKARGATQLAVLRLLDRKPDLAIKALALDIGKELPADLVRQREQLHARALLELDKPADALTLLANDQTRDADRLRADIYWRGQQWKEAAQTLGRLVLPPGEDGTLDAETPRLVVSLAAALTLANDQAGLARLRAVYGKPIAKTRYADTFSILAGDPGGGAGGDPRTEASRIAQLGALQSFMAANKPGADAAKPSAVN